MNDCTSIENKPAYAYPRLRRLAIDLGYTLIFCVMMALIVTYVMRIGRSFPENLVFSMCHGMLTTLLIDGGRLWLWGICKPPKIPFFTLLVVSIPAAKYFGNLMAVHLLGLPPQNVFALQAQNATGFLILSILGCFFVTWFFWTRGKLEYLRAQAEAEKARAAAIEKQAMQAQLQLLQAQIEPHMLFNTLANLQGLIAVDTPRAQHMLEQLIIYLRATLSSSRAEQTTLAHEFSLMDAYLELMSIRMGTRLKYTLDLSENLRETCIPPMLLQPLIENAIKHGIEPNVEGGNITVVATQQADLLHLSVADTGLGLQDSTSSQTKGTNVGLANVRERLQALYGDRASLSLTANTPTGALAQLTIPLS
ncbi:MAG: sensor histidine kinase [Burkholderiaceae bacterium]